MKDRFERFLYYVSELSKNIHKLTSDEMEKVGLKGTHAVYLMALLKNPDGLTAPQLCEYTGKDKADVSRLMAIMEKKGLVTKESVNKNLYRAVFKLSDKGAEAAEFVKARAKLAVDTAGRELTDETRTVFYNALESISENLSALVRDGIPEE